MTYEQLCAHVVSGHVRAADGYVYRNPAPRVDCADGWSVSIQASQYHYCEPRTNAGPWVEFELGYPSELDPELEPFAEEPDTTRTVFAYVPASVVLALIAKHGGAK